MAQFDLANLKIQPIEREKETETTEVSAPISDSINITDTLTKTGADFQAQQSNIGEDTIEELPTFNIESKVDRQIDETKVSRFIEHSKGLGKSREETEQAYIKGLSQGMFDIQAASETPSVKEDGGIFNSEFAKVFTEAIPQIGADIAGGLRSFGGDISKVQRGAFAPVATGGEVEEAGVETGLLGKVITRGLEREKEFGQRKTEQDTEQTAIEKGLDVVGQGIGFISDTFGEVFMSTLGTLATDEQAEFTKKAITDISESDLGKKGIELAKKGGEEFTAFESENPRIASQLRNLGNLGLLGFDIAGLGLGKQAVQKTGKSIDELATTIVNTTKQVKAPDLTGIKEAITEGAEVIGELGKPIKEVGKKAVDIAGTIAKAPIKGAGVVTSSLLGKSTGAGREAIEEAFRSGGKDTFAKALRGEITDVEILQDAKIGLETIKDQRKALYGKDYEKLVANTTPLDITDIKDDFIKQLEDFKIEIDDNGVLNFEISKITQTKSIKQIEDIYGDLFSWKDTTPEGLDILKQRIADRWTGGEGTKKGDLFSTSASNKVKNKIIGEVSEYKAMNKAYEETTDMINDIQKTLALGDKAQKMTAITRLNQAMKDNISFRKEAVELLEKASDIELKPALAGAALREVTPKGLSALVTGGVAGAGVMSGLFSAPVVGFLLASSPRVIGEMARAVGVSVNAFKKGLEGLKKLYEKGKTAIKEEGGKLTDKTGVNNNIIEETKIFSNIE